MNTTLKYQLLNEMGIPYWLDRTGVFGSDMPIFGAKCLVLLPEKINPEALEENKILNGMVNVLGFSRNEVSIAWIQGKNSRGKSESVAILKRELLKWAPESLLIMGEAFSKTILESIGYLDSTIVVQVTHHPKHLQNSPEDKKKAYRDLLTLKQVLTHRKAI